MKDTNKRLMDYRDALSQDLRKIESALSESAFEKEISEFTTKNPIKALSIAALTGFIIGCWWKLK